jgi:hypothetical protein
MDPQQEMDPQQKKEISAAFFTRAGNAGDEFRKSTITFSVGALATFFLSLTGEKAPDLSDAQRLMLLVAQGAFALATSCGLLAWFFAGRYFHAQAKHDPAPTLHTLKNGFDGFLAGLFLIGMFVSAVYLFHKIWPVLIVSILCGWLTMNAAGQQCGQGKPSAASTLVLTADQVKQAQEALKKERFYLGRIDGKIGPRTQQALRKFQERVGLPRTGGLDEATFHRLVPPAPSVQDGVAAGLAKPISGGRQPVASSLPRRPQ